MKAESEDLLQHAIRETWGYTRIRPLQLEAMEAVLRGQDALVILSTGSGKSLCYQAPALIMKKTVVVLSPLIALMKDQVDSLRQAGVRAACIHSASTPAERMETRRLAESGQLHLLYLAPERLCMEHVLEWLAESVPMGLLAVDEAHCISTWGHDFRPEYRQIANLRERLRDVPVLACTATATPAVAQDIAVQLKLRKPVRVTGTFDRPNFTYRVLPRKDANSTILAITRHFRGRAGIIYCLSRKQTESLAETLAGNGIKVLPYHAGLSDPIRHENQEAFLSGSCDVMVATVAFGMGIDRPDVRFVIHVGIPESLENYLQESGRAGRDGAPADCILLYSYGDVMLWRKRANSADEDLRSILNRRLAAMVNYVESGACRRQTLLKHFGETHSGSCGQCDRCVPELNQTAAWQSSTSNSTTVQRKTKSLPRNPSLQTIGSGEQIPAKILSHFARAGTPLSAAMAVQGLMGLKPPLLQLPEHQFLSTYGLLREYSIPQIEHWIDQLLAQHCFTVAVDPHSKSRFFELTSHGWDVMMGKQQVNLTLRALEPVLDDRCFDLLMEQLRQWRRLQAAEQKVPAYVILHDATLRNLAAARPQMLDDLREVPGMGQKRIDRYGKALVEILREPGAAIHER